MRRRRSRVKSFWLPKGNSFSSFNRDLIATGVSGTTVKWPLDGAYDEGAEGQVLGGNAVYGRLAHGENLVVDRIVGRLYFRVKHNNGGVNPGDLTSIIRAAIVKIPFQPSTGIVQESTGVNDLWSLDPANQPLFAGVEAPRRMWYRSWAFNLGPLAVKDSEDLTPPGSYIDIAPKCNLRATDRLFLLMLLSNIPVLPDYTGGLEYFFSHDLRVLAHVKKGT